MYLLKLVGEGIVTVIGWISQTLEAMIDWGWAGPSEGICIMAALALIGAIIGIRKLL